MNMKLVKILNYLDPSECIDKIVMRGYEALEAIPSEKRKVVDYESFLECSSYAHRLISNYLLGIKEKPQVYESERSKVQAYLMNNYTRWQNPINDILNNEDGGYDSFLKQMALKLAINEAERCIQLKVYEFWQNTDSSEWIDIIDSYFEKYREIYPPYIRNQILHPQQFLNVLINHPRIVQQLRQVRDS